MFERAAIVGHPMCCLRNRKSVFNQRRTDTAFVEQVKQVSSNPIAEVNHRVQIDKSV